MNTFTIRVIAAIVIMALLIYQTSRAAPGSHRRRAFALAASSIGVFLVMNGVIAFGIDPGVARIPLIIVALLLLGGSLVFLVLAWRRGEMHEQVERMQQAIAEERERRQGED